MPVNNYSVLTLFFILPEWNSQRAESALYALQLFLGLVYGILTVASAVLTCRATCRCCDGASSSPNGIGDASVAYVAGGQVPGTATVVNVPAGALVQQQQQQQDLPPKYDQAAAANEEKEDGKYQRFE